VWLDTRSSVTSRVRVRVARDTVGPIDAGGREPCDPRGVGHVHQRREVVLLRVALVVPRVGGAGCSHEFLRQVTCLIFQPPPSTDSLQLQESFINFSSLVSVI
jgi:hypothetical protein